jgi:hypothetical protein
MNPPSILRDKDGIERRDFSLFHQFLEHLHAVRLALGSYNVEHNKAADILFLIPQSLTPGPIYVYKPAFG